jgi:ribosomal protein S18 acetylase RimI-like enzyme
MISFRSATSEDEPFLATVYASTREQELALVDWTEGQKADFLRMQFDAQHRYYHEHYHDTSWDLILRDGEPIGRLYVARWPEEIRIVDIALLPAHRGSGIGSQLIGELLREAEQANKPLRIHVEQYNPAMRLYERLGFQPVGRHGVYVLMERTPSSSNAGIS